MTQERKETGKPWSPVESHWINTKPYVAQGSPCFLSNKI